MTIKQFEFRSRNGDAIRADVRFIESNTKKPVILCLHGFKGFKDWGPFPAIREKLALAGFVAVGMNFSHNGVGDDLQNFTELDRFAENTFSLEVTETEDVIGAIARAEITTSDAELPISAAEYDATRIGILGHSRGAAIGILVGSKSTLVRAVAAWAPVSKFDRYSDRQKAVWRERGYFEVKNMRTGQTMRLNASLLDDVEHHREYLDILHAAELMNS
ncbi:MAG: dienelactone hydrolase family protein, partial [Candidatus Kapaibacterium sp.]